MAAGAIIMSPVKVPQFAFAQQTNTPTTLNIGIVAPHTTFYPDAASRWIAGVKQGVEQIWGSGGSTTQIQLIENLYDGRPSTAVANALELMNHTALNALIAWIDIHAAGELRRMALEHHLPLLLSSLGANIAREKTEGPSFAYQTLDYWHSLTALGVWAAKTLGKRAVATSSFYESGYDLPFAFQAGYLSAGGTIVASHVSHLPTSNGDLTTLMNSIAAASPDVVFASYSGQDAVGFMQAYGTSGLKRSVPLVASSFTVDDALLATLGDSAVGTYSCVPWLSDPFGLLGQRTASSISALLSQSSLSSTFRRAAYIPAFQNGTPSSASQAPAFYLRQVQTGASGPMSTVIDTVAADDTNTMSPIADVESTLQTSVKTGWLYEYLFR
jgi:ABC-type branched-subunit amino acid transport system substrate-binding protein